MQTVTINNDERIELIVRDKRNNRIIYHAMIENPKITTRVKNLENYNFRQSEITFEQVMDVNDIDLTGLINK